MAENDLQKNPLKILEYMGKEIITGFVDNLVKNNVVKLDEEEKKRFNNAERGDKPRVFVDAVRQKRHEAGQMLIQTFLNVDQKTSNNKVHLEPETRPAEWEESTDTLKLCSPEEFLRCCTERAGEIYPIQERNDRTRQALIICNIEFDHLTLREGADFDITGMKGLLEDLGYTVVVEKNLTASDMESVLKKFAAQPEHRSSDSTFLVLMSHGTLHGICGTTHSDKTPDVLVYDKIYQIFNNHKCRGLRDKPKVIIVQACRGGNPGEVWVRDSPAILTDSSSQSEKNLEADAVRLSHVEKDFIALYSTTPHNVSYRDPTKGSPFITQLVTCFQKYSWSCHILEIFVKVQQSFEKPSIESQMPTIERTTLSRYFYLFPGN